MNEILKINEDNKKIKSIHEAKMKDSEKDFILSNNHLKLEN